MPATTRIAPDMDAPRPDWVMPEARDVTVLGHRIRYWEKGEGRPLVLCHGFSGSAVMEWGRVIDALAERCRVIAWQCVGFAPSEQPDITYSTEALLRHLSGFMAALGLEDVVLAGESYGGWQVGSYAARAKALGLHPISKLIIVAGPVGKIERRGPEPNGFTNAPVMKEVAALLARDPIVDNEAFKARIAKDSGLMKAELSVEAVAGIEVPTLLVWGDKDQLIPLEIGERALAAIPDARLVVFEGIGHIPSVECPNAFTAVVGAFAAS